MTDGPFLGLAKQSQQKRKATRSPGPALGLHGARGWHRRRGRAADEAPLAGHAAGRGGGMLKRRNSSFILKSDPAQTEPRKD